MSALRALARPLRALARPVLSFARLDAAGGLVLFAAAAAALLWANSPARGLYHRLFDGAVTLGAFRVPTATLIDDGLMSLFFFVVGAEIKRELAVGELSSFRKALLPAVGALGGMVAPAAIFAALNRGGPGLRGWAIPMATDIAFSVGVLALLKGRVARGLVVFLTALAIFDDLGGILVIAIFYGHGLHAWWLLAAAGLLGIAVAAGRRGAIGFAPYLILGVPLWIAVHQSGVHATMAGVALGLAVPARARFVHALQPWVTFLILPLFALGSSGVDLSGVRAADLLQPICLGAGLGLFAGKQVGIFAFTMASVKLGLAAMPGGARPAQLYGVAIVGGIGFTVALFIAGLAFPDAALLAQARLGILLGSLAAGVIGYGWLRVWGGGPRLKASD